GHVRNTPNVLEDLEPVHTRHGNVQDDDVGVVLIEFVQPLLTVTGRNDCCVLPLKLKTDSQRIEYLRVIVDNKNFHEESSSATSSNASAYGITNLNVAPAPGALSTQMRPP